MLNIGTVFKDHRGLIAVLSIAAVILISGCDNPLGDVTDTLKESLAPSRKRRSIPPGAKTPKTPEKPETSETPETPFINGRKLRDSSFGPVYLNSDTKQTVIVINRNIESIESTGTSTVKSNGSMEFLSALPGMKIERIIFRTPGQLKSIGSGAFFKHKVRAPQIPEGVTDIGRYAFAYNDMELLQLPESLKKIGSHAFAHNKLQGEVRIPKGVTQIGPYAFKGNETLRVRISLQSLAKTPENAFPDTAVINDYNGKRIVFDSASNSWIISPAGS